MDVRIQYLLSDCPFVKVVQIQLSEGGVVLVEAESRAAEAACPYCGRLSDRIHGRYTRHVQDLPCQDRQATLRLQVRKFVCANPECCRLIFCERIPDLLAPHARTTERLTEAHRTLGFALGGEAGSRVAQRFSIPTSPDTLLRRVKQQHSDPFPPPRVIGIDDWAWRKGQKYGTIVIDLRGGESSRVVGPSRKVVHGDRQARRSIEQNPSLSRVVASELGHVARRSIAATRRRCRPARLN
jgi:transposase